MATDLNDSPHLNAIEYIAQTAPHFDYRIYYDNYCDGFNREQTQIKLKRDLKECMSRSTDAEACKWIQEQLEFEVPVAKTDLVDSFWIFKFENKALLTSKLNKAIRENRYAQELHDQVIKQIDKRQTNENTTPPQYNCNVIEADTIIKFDHVSICSKLKSHGKMLFDNYNTLADNKKILCAYCLNGILDLSDDLQKPLFTDDQWHFMKDYFGSNNVFCLPTLSDNINEKIKRIKVLIASGQANSAYLYALCNIQTTNVIDQWIMKVLIYVLNCYLERTYIFTSSNTSSSSSSSVTDPDISEEVWRKLLELVFNTNGFKIDDDPEHCQRETTDPINISKAKLAIDTKRRIDHDIEKTNVDGVKPAFLSMHFGGIYGGIFGLELMDAGLYVMSHVCDISLQPNLFTFAENMDTWIRNLVGIRNEYFGRPEERSAGSNSSYSSHRAWVRGTFSFPAKTDQPQFPKNLLTSPFNATPSGPLRYSCKVHTLNDGTIVTQQYLKKDRRNKRKRRHNSKKRRISC